MPGEYGTAQGVGVVVPHQAKVRVNAALKSCSLCMVGFMALCDAVIGQKSTIKVAFGTVGNIDSPGLDNNTQIVDSLRVMLKKNFIGVQCQTKFPLQIHAYDRQEGMQNSPAVVNRNTIINVATIVSQAEGVFHEMIKAIEIEVGKNLAGQITNRQTTPWTGVKKAFVVRQPFPVCTPPLDDTVGRRIIKNNLAA